MSKRFELYCGDCLEVMPQMEAESIDSVVCDPPYGLGFMGKKWDHGVPGVEFWKEVLRVAKPGAHLLAFGGTRTYHRLACAIEDAGFEVRDCLVWMYGSGFPKSLDVSKAMGDSTTETQRHRENAKGWGTALKPAWEPCILARKPLRGTVVDNVVQFGTGAINVGACRIGVEKEMVWGGVPSKGYGGGLDADSGARPVEGRWPANLIHDGSEEVEGVFPQTKTGEGGTTKETAKLYSFGSHCDRETIGYGDDGNASRYFYCAKADREDRDEGCTCAVREAHEVTGRKKGSIGQENPRSGVHTGARRNIHPTVKPTELMRYLCRLVTPKEGVILDPFMGSGSTGKAAMLEGFRFVGIDLSGEYVEIARQRIEYAAKMPKQEELFV